MAHDEKLSRVKLMASGAETWDLSDNDLAALRHVLDRLTLANALAEAVERLLDCDPVTWDPGCKQSEDECRAAVSALHQALAAFRGANG